MTNYFPTKYKRQAWCLRFVSDLSHAMRKKAARANQSRSSRLNSLDALLIQAIIEDGWALGDNGGYSIAVSLLSEITIETDFIIKNRLKLLARIGIIGVVGGWGPKHRRLPTEIFIHPAFAKACRECHPVAKLVGMIDFLAATWNDRRDHIGDIQGFSDEVPFGKFEPGFKAIDPSDLPDSQLSQEIKARVEGAYEDPEIRKKRESYHWRKTSLEFVKSTADYWVSFRSSRGFGNERPTWDGENIPPTQRKVQQDIIKLFQSYGGKTTAIAWMIFCGSKRSDDAKGRPEFKPDLAFSQFTGSDKRPDQFAKYFDLILGNEHFKAWICDKAVMARARDTWGYLIDCKPRTSSQLNQETHWTERTSASEYSETTA